MSDQHPPRGEQHIHTAKGGPIGIPRLFGREREPVIAMVAPGVFLPARKLVKASISGSEPGERERSSRESKS
jgi:hypothetical protein